jgi:hypothetical protein
MKLSNENKNLIKFKFFQIILTILLPHANFNTNAQEVIFNAKKNTNDMSLGIAEYNKKNNNNDDMEDLCSLLYCQKSMFELKSFCCNSKCCDMIEYISRNE